MAVWHNPRETTPADGQECLLIGKNESGELSSNVFGPIPWSSKMGMWFDFFATREASHAIKPEQVGLWFDWTNIAPDETN